MKFAAKQIQIDWNAANAIIRKVRGVVKLGVLQPFEISAEDVVAEKTCKKSMGGGSVRSTTLEAWSQALGAVCAGVI